MPSVEVVNREAIARIMTQMVPRTICFQYEDDEGNTTLREAEPYSVKNGKLFGWCLQADAIRQFRLAKMGEIYEGRTFKPRYRIEIPT